MAIGATPVGPALHGIIQPTLIGSAGIAGTFVTPAASGVGSHLGHGYFLHDITHGAKAVLIDVHAALPGDANGDGRVDGSDFNLWNAHKFTTGTDWLRGDFNGDGATDGTDFAIWNAHEFTSLGNVPEPAGAGIGIVVAV